MYIKDEDLIIDNLQKWIENGEEVTLTPQKFSTLFMIVFTFLLGSLGLFSPYPAIRLTLLLWLYTTQLLLYFISKEGQLILTRDSIKFYKLNDAQEIYWENVDAVYEVGRVRGSNILTVRLKGNLKVEISRYYHKEISSQTLIKLCERNFSKSKTP